MKAAPGVRRLLLVGGVVASAITASTLASDGAGARQPNIGETSDSPPPPLDLRRSRVVAVADSSGRVLRRPDGSEVRVTVGGARMPPPPVNLAAVTSAPADVRAGQTEIHEVSPLSDAEKVNRIDALERYRAERAQPSP